jgi:N-acetyl-gamma-glutamyl-phosphate reductase
MCAYYAHGLTRGSLMPDPNPLSSSPSPPNSRAPSIRVGIYGASGTTGVELTALLSSHGHCELVFATSREYAGRSLRSVDPAAPDVSLVDPADVTGRQADVIFVCLPHGHAARVAETALESGARVIDLSGDLRLRSSKLHAETYGTPRCEELAREAVYGLTEWARPRLPAARLVSNPGCYATCAALALQPLARRALLEHVVIIDAKSGVSGAGRQATASTHFCAVADDVRPYKLGHQHRHTPEIRQLLAWSTPEGLTQPRIVFCPHVVPIERGMLATIVARLPGRTPGEVRRSYEEDYGDEPFIELLGPDEPARIRAVVRTNRAVIGVHEVPDDEHVVITCAIDNLLKGAAGQALQNMNVMFGFPETEGFSR